MNADGVKRIALTLSYLDYSKNDSTKGRGVAALTSSRELAYLSTVVDARELNCRVRNGSGWNLSAMAA